MRQRRGDEVGATGAPAGPGGRGHRGWRPQVRAGLIAVAIAVALVEGAPFPTSRGARQWVEDNLPADLASLIYRTEERRRVVIEPFEPIVTFAGLHQRWDLFSTAPPTAHRLVIEARTEPDGPWTVLFRAGDPEHQYLAEQLHYRRVRGAWNPHNDGRPRRGYPAFVDWVAREVFDREPEVVQMRVSEELLAIRPRGGGARPTGEVDLVEVRSRPEAP